MNKAIATVLNKVLGDWVENLNPEQLNMSVFKGKIELRNLHLKRSALDKLGVPFQLEYGFVGYIMVDIPWASLSSKPLIVHIEDVLGLLSPKPADTWSSEEETKRFQESRIESLANFEALHQPELIISNEPGYVEKLIENIVDNIQIRIHRVYFRYEDKITSKLPFAIGIKLAEATAETCNSLWKPEFVKESKKSFKLLKVQELSVFLDYDEGILICEEFYKKNTQDAFPLIAKNDFAGTIDHKFILCPLTCQVEAVINKVSVENESKISVRIDQELLGIQMYTEYLAFVMKLLDFMKIFNIFKTGVVSAFAQRGLGENEKNEYKQLYMEWRNSQIKFPKAGKTAELKKQLDAAEEGIAVDSLTEERNNAIQDYELNKVINEKNLEIKNLMENDAGFGSRISGIFERKAETQRKREIQENEKQMKIQKLQDEIAKINEDRKLPEKPLLTEKTNSEKILNLEFKLQKASLSIFDPKLLISIEFNLFQINLGLFKTSQFLRLYLHSFTMKDHQNISNLLPYIIDSNSFEFIFEKNKIILNTSGMDVILNLVPLLNLIHSLKNKISNHIDLDKIVSAASSKTSEYIKSGEGYLKDIVKHGASTSLSLDINLTAPVIYIPNKNTSTFLVMDLGKLQVKSNQIQGRHDSYDGYLITLTEIKFTTVWKLKTLKDWESFTDLLSPTFIRTNIKLYKRIEKSKPGLKILVDFGDCSWKISNLQVFFFLGFLEIFASPEPPPPKTLEIVENEDIKEKIKELGEIMPLKILIGCKIFEIEILDTLNTIGALKIVAAQIRADISSNSDIRATAEIQDLEILDPTAPIFSKLLSKTSELSQDSPKKRNLLLKLIADIQPSQDFTEISMALNQITLVASSDFIYKFLSYTEKITKKLPKSSKAPIESVPSSFSIRSFKQSFSLRVLGITLSAPLSLSDPSSKILNLSTSAMLTFNSASTCRITYDYLGRTCEKDFASSLEEAGVTLSHMSIFISSPPHSSNVKYLLNPSRLTLDYKNAKQKQMGEQRVDIRIESLLFAIGFFDIAALKELAALYTPPKSKGEARPIDSKVKSMSKFICNIDGDSLQLNILDDTRSIMMSICHAQLSNISLLAVIDASTKQVLFSTLLTSSCFNKDLGAWEPMTEDYKLEVNLNQETPEAPLLVTLASEEFLNFNVSLSILNVLSAIATNFGKQLKTSQAPVITEEVRTKAGFEYEICNYLECPIAAKVAISGNHDWWQIRSLKSYRFTQAYIDHLIVASNAHLKTSSSTNSTQAPTALCLEIGDFSPIGQLFIEEIGLTSFTLQKENGKACCAMEVLAEGNLRRINIMSAVQFCNNSSDSLFLGYESTVIEVPQHKNKPLPLQWNSDLDSVCLLLSPRTDRLTVSRYLSFDGKHYALEANEYYNDAEGVAGFKSLELNPCYLVRNLLPCAISIISRDGGEELCRLGTGEEVFIDSVDPTKEYFFQVVLRTDFGFFNTETVKIQDNLLINLPHFEGSSIRLSVCPFDPSKNSFVNISSYTRKPSPASSVCCKQLQFHSEHIIVNKTDHNLILNSLVLPKHSWGLFNSTAKARLVCSDFSSKFSSEFSIETISIAGQVNIEDKHKEFTLSLGVTIALGSGPLIASKMVTIVPRYMISNLLKTDIFIRVKDSEQNTLVKTQEVLPFQPGTLDAALQVSADGVQWSGPFAVDEIEDFQLCFMRAKLKRVAAAKLWKNPKWTSGEKQYVRVMIYTKDEATIHVSFIKPKDPEFLIVNKTKEEIKARQKDYDGFVVMVPPDTSLPWAFDNNLIKEKRIVLLTAKFSQDYSLEKIKKCKSLGEYHVEVVVKGVTREIRIKHESKYRDSVMLNTGSPSNTIKFTANFAGLGVSVMDLKNNEQLYISLSKIYLKYKINTLRDHNTQINSTKFDIRLDNFQIDNMDNNKGSLYAVILCRYQMASEVDDQTPFLQFKLHKEVITDLKSELSLNKLKWLELSIQPLQINVNEETIYVLIGLKEFSSAFASDPSPITIDCGPPSLPYKLNQIERKAYFEFIRLCAIKFEVNFRKAPHSSTVSLKSGLGVLGILSTIGGAFANISETPLKFNEILVTHGFQTLANLTSTLLKNYIRQALFQLYKILGSSDMLGNPLGLIDKLGTGVFEFVTEPAKGLLKGPKAFASGVGKGVKSLVGGVISGGFGSVSKITGSLYNVIKEVGGDEPVLTRGNTKIEVFMYEGFKGGVMDVVHGVSGVFTKPYKGAKEQGAKGLLKGAGSGLFGLISSPVKLALRFGTTITSGIARGVTLITKGKVNTFGRARFPRQIGPKRILEQYDNELAQAQVLLESEEKRQRIMFYAHYQEDRDVIIIITSRLIWVLVDAETYRKIYLKNIRNMELHRVKDFYVLECRSTKGDLQIKGYSFGKLASGYFAILSMLGVSKIISKRR